MANDYYEVIEGPKARQRARAEVVLAEFQGIQQGFAELPTKNALASNAQLLAQETGASAANAYILTSEYPISELVQGVTVRFLATNTNTGACTVNVDGTGEIDLVAIDGTALGGQEIVAARPIEIFYDGRRFLLMNSARAITAQLVLESALTPLNLEINRQMSPVTLPAASGGQSPYTYAVTGLPDGLEFSPSNRQITGTPTNLGQATAVYAVTDANTNEFEYSFIVNIVPVILVLQNPPNRTLVLNTDYEFTLPAATGGTSPYTYQLAGLPEGLTFDPGQREVSGSPTETGNFTLTYSARDSGTPEQSTTSAFTLTVRSEFVLAVAQPNDRTFTPNVEISPFTLPPATGGLEPYSYIVTGLPTGLSFDDDTRQVSGTPSATGTSSVTYRVVDAENTRVDRTFDIAVEVAGQRFITTLTSSDAVSVSATELQSGNSYAATERNLRLPTWVGAQRIVIGQPSDSADLTSISLGGLGNSISDFTKQSGTVTVGGITYSVWVSNEEQGDVISGETIEVRP